jgi:hypothetical protein
LYRADHYMDKVESIEIFNMALDSGIIKACDELLQCEKPTG